MWQHNLFTLSQTDTSAYDWSFTLTENAPGSPVLDGSYVLCDSTGTYVVWSFDSDATFAKVDQKTRSMTSYSTITLGGPVAMSDDTVVLMPHAGGNASIFRRSGDTWTLYNTVSGSFTHATLSEDSDWLILGDTASGNIYSYTDTGLSYSFQNTLSASFSSFTLHALSVSKTGGRLAFDDNSSVKVYTGSPASGWTLEQSLVDAGTSYKDTFINEDGDMIVTWNSYSSNDYLETWERSGTTWTVSDVTLAGAGSTTLGSFYTNKQMDFRSFCVGLVTGGGETFKIQSWNGSTWSDVFTTSVDYYNSRSCVSYDGNTAFVNQYNDMTFFGPKIRIV